MFSLDMVLVLMMAATNCFSSGYCKTPEPTWDQACEARAVKAENGPYYYDSVEHCQLPKPV